MPSAQEKYFRHLDTYITQAKMIGWDYQELEDASQELAYLYAMLDCPWRNKTGICGSGCQTEPACETGWSDEFEIRKEIAEQLAHIKTLIEGLRP